MRCKMRLMVAAGVLAWLLVVPYRRAAGQVTPSTTALVFDPLYVGLTSSPQSLQLTNSGGTPFYLFSSATSGDFLVVSNNCPISSAASLKPFAAGASCVVTIQFTPAVAGLETGSLTVPVTDSSFQPAGSVTVSLAGTGKFPLTAASLNFGPVLENSNVLTTLPLTLGNSGGAPFTFSAGTTNPDYTVDISQCPQRFFFTPGSSCVLNVTFAPSVTGPDPAMLQISAAMAGNNQPIGAGSILLTGIGRPLDIGFAPFGVQLMGGTYQSAVNVFNTSFAPVAITSATLSGSGFVKDNGCVGTLPARSGCAINISFSPTSNISYNGALTMVDGDPTSPQTIAITGAGTALQITPQPRLFDFGEQHLLTTSAPQTVVLTNVSKTPVSFQAGSGDRAFAVANTCRSTVPANGSCTVSVAYQPSVNGGNDNALTIRPADPIGPQSFGLSGLGVGIGHNRVRLHYDYMVASDHTHDPEVTAPGAIQRVVDAFAQHGVELIIDPHHTAIPEIETLTFSRGELCPGSQSNFFTLRDQYFVPKFPDQHYAMFAHKVTDPEIFCAVGGATGQAELPGLSFVVALGAEQEDGFSADVFSMFMSGTTMHELGHNLGLHHGGSDDINYKPNYLSVMSYAQQLSGIVQAVQAGSTAMSACSADADCVSGQSCIFHSCRRLDYSSQVLPVGGNTPGSLDESDLDETAGLGSGSADLGSFSTCQSFVNIFASNGPVDWDGDGAATNRHLSFLIDLQGEQFDLRVECPGSLPLLRLAGFNDWAYLLRTEGDRDGSPTPDAQGNQGTPVSNEIPASFAKPRSVPEISMEEARLQHVLLAPRSASLVIQPGCLASPRTTIGSDQAVTVTVLGAPDFNVAEVDLDSLRFHRAQPVTTVFADVNGDGIPDLVIQLRRSEILLAHEATKARLTGWLKNSQMFVAEAELESSSSNAATTCAW